VGIAAGAAVWVRRTHPGDKIHQVQARLLEKSGGFRSSTSSAAPMANVLKQNPRMRRNLASVLPGKGIGSAAEVRFTISLHGPMMSLLGARAMRYAAIHGRQKKVGVDGSRTHAAPDDYDISHARRGPFRTLRASEGLAGPALRTSGDVDADSGDWHDVRYVPKRPRSRSDRNSSPRIRFTLHLCAQRISYRSCATRVSFHDSVKLDRRVRKIEPSIATGWPPNIPVRSKLKCPLF
jgi:hypothetical protein